MAGNIKGITIEFRGDTTSLDKALRQIKNETRSIDRELKQVDKALKFNPTSVDLWRQKQQLLTQKISETKEKLSLLKAEQQRMDASRVDENSEEYRKLQREIITTESQAKNLEAQLRKIGNVNLRAASESAKELGNKLTAASHSMREVSMAGAAVVGVLGTMAYKASETADKLNTMSKVYGINTQDLQKYKLAADQVDASVETIAKSHTKLKKSMYSAKDGTGSAAEAFKTLGVEVKNADGSLRDGDAVWQETIAALGKMENETERDAIAMQLMGKSASELNPLIEDGGETYKRTAELFEKYNLDLIDQETLDRANEFNDGLKDIKSMGSLAFSMLGAELAGYLLPVMEKAVDIVGKIVGWLAKLDPKVLAIIGAVAGVVAVIAPLLMVLGKVAFAISSIMSLMATLGLSFAALGGPVGIAIAIIAAIIAIGVLLYKHWDDIKKYASALGKHLKKIFTDIKKVVTTVWNAIKTVVTAVVNAIVSLITARFNLVKTIVTTAFNAIKTVTTTVWNAIKDVITTVITAIQTLLTGRFNTMVSVAKTTFTAIQSAASTAWNAIKSATSSAWSAISSSTSSAWNSIKNAITSPINSALSTVRSIVSSIRNLFPISIGRLLSNISLPHFSLRWSSKSFGKLGTISYPTGLSVSWYAKGGIFNAPTIAGIGEAGSEAVVPLDKFWDKMDKIADAAHGDEITINVYATPNMDVNQLAQAVEQKLVAMQKRRLAANGSI